NDGVDGTEDADDGWGDGQTLVQTAGLRYSDADARADDGAYDDEGYDDQGYDDQGYDDGYDQDDDGADDGRPAEPRRRLGSVLTLGAVAVAAGAVRPGVTLAVVAVLAV